MIKRYTREEMGEIWSEQNKFETMKAVEVTVAKVQAELGIIPKTAATQIAKKAKFKINEIEELEKVTKHDVIAFVTNMAKYVGKDGRYIHYGLTSSDVIDSALSLRIAQAGSLVLSAIKDLESAITKQIKKHSKTLCAGRTHGMHAEPTTFGMKLCGFLVELGRNKNRFKQALEQCKVVKLSGAVGTYSSLSPQVERKVGKYLKLKPEHVATQVIPRDRHAELLNSIALLGSGLERLSVELRHLQRTEVYEVVEGFSKGQKGSSAMPHKKNPISGENLTGVARLLRSYAAAAMENIALWHERDISHSSVERVVFPDAFILIDYSLHRMKRVISNLQVNKEKMLENMDLSGGQLFSSHILLELVKTGLSREEAYKLVQACSHSLQKGEHLKDKLLQDKKIKVRLKPAILDKVFSGQTHIKSIEKNIKKVLTTKRI